jgi:hypothetical protein
MLHSSVAVGAWSKRCLAVALGHCRLCVGVCQAQMQQADKRNVSRYSHGLLHSAAVKFIQENFGLVKVEEETKE